MNTIFERAMAIEEPKEYSYVDFYGKKQHGYRDSNSEIIWKYETEYYKCSITAVKYDYTDSIRLIFSASPKDDELFCIKVPHYYNYVHIIKRRGYGKIYPRDVGIDHSFSFDAYISRSQDDRAAYDDFAQKCNSVLEKVENFDYPIFRAEFEAKFEESGITYTEICDSGRDMHADSRVHIRKGPLPNVKGKNPK